MDGQELTERVARQLRRLPQDRQSLTKVLVGALSAQELIGERLDQLLDMLVHTVVRRTRYVPGCLSNGRFYARTASMAALRAFLCWERDIIDSGQLKLTVGKTMQVLLHRVGEHWEAEITNES